MAMTHDYLDYLNQRVGIAPANSQEELQAAQTIAGLMSHHDVEPSIEEFDAPSLSGLVPAILSVLMFLGVLVSGLGVVVLAIVGLVLALIPTLLAVLRLLGRAPSLSFGPAARSQNVVAVHRASGPLVAKGNRPIVVVAHYDTPRENFLYSTALAPYLPLVVKASTLCRYVVAVCAFVQIMGFIPAPARLALWIVGIVAALPGVLLAAGSIYERISPCTLGANDNKSAVASLLGVMENVRPSGLVPTPRTPEAPQEVEEPDGLEEVDDGEDAGETLVASEDVPVVHAEPAEPVKPLGIRRGADVLRSLEIMPDTCDIEYVEHVDEVEDAPARAPRGASVSLFDIDPLPEPEPEFEPDIADDIDEVDDGVVAEDALDEPAPEEPVAEEAQEDAVEDVSDPVGATSSLSPIPDDAGTTRENLLSNGRFSLVMDEGDRGVGPKDSSGLTMVDEGSFDSETPQASPARPAAPDDPEWGKSSYRPQVSNVARRASLFDLPDPSLGESDPLGDPDATRVSSSKSRFGRSSAPAAAPEKQDSPDASASSEVSAPEPIETLASTASRGKGALSGLLSRIKGAFANKGADSDEESAGDWLGSSDDSDDPVWRGGAAVRGGLRFVEEDEVVPSEDEMVEEVLSVGDDALICPDIWFVALGGSSLDHAGMRAFLQQHRQEIRGSFIINLDCVGAGELSVLTHEGVEGDAGGDPPPAVPDRLDRGQPQQRARSAGPLPHRRGRARERERRPGNPRYRARHGDHPPRVEVLLRTSWRT